MKLIEITIENWKSIGKTILNIDELLVIIGENNSGKSSLTSAIACLLNPINFKTDCIMNSEMPMVISGKFSGLHINTLKIIKESCDLTLKFFLDEKEISQEEYVEFLKPITLLHITSMMDNSGHVETFIESISKIFPDFKLIEKSDSFKDSHMSHSIFRNLLFKNLIKFRDYISENSIKLVQSIYIIFENPEMYLLPHEERELYDCIVDLSNSGIFFSIETRSPRFVGLQQYPSICLVRNINNRSSFFQFRGELFHGDEVKNFNMNYWINSDRGEIFFSKKVILVEGQTDKILLGYLAKKLGVFRYDYCIVECGSKSLLPQFSKLLNSFRINYAVVYDKDNHKWRTEIELQNSNEKNRQIHKTIRKEYGYYVEFENDIEEELYHAERDRKNYRNKPFSALQYAMTPEFKIPSKLEDKIKAIFK